MEEDLYILSVDVKLITKWPPVQGLYRVKSEATPPPLLALRWGRRGEVDTAGAPSDIVMWASREDANKEQGMVMMREAILT